MSDLVSVVIPAFNAEATIDDTLRSVRSQTHSNLEILVIDDGSHDRTAEIVSAQARIDKRVTLIRQSNIGVAGARNNGVQRASADLLAFLDADDLWGPDKIRKQLVALRDGGPRIGLVYTWYAFIDSENRIGATYRPMEIGDVVERLCLGNFVGNGSSVLVTRTAFDKAGGYDPTLRARGGQGCEDWQFYFHVAEGYRFALVPELLTGYRWPGSLSSNPIRMLRSSTLVAEQMRQRRPQFRATIKCGNINYNIWLLERAIKYRHPFDVARLAWALLRRQPGSVARLFAQRLYRWVTKRLPAKKLLVASADQGPIFVIGNPGVSS